MPHKHIMIMCFAISIVLCQNMLAAGDQVHGIKDAIKRASARAMPGWSKARGLPLAVGVALTVVPPAIATVSFLESFNGHNTQKKTDTLIGIWAVGLAASCVAVPVGTLLAARQTWLIQRDLALLRHATNSTAYLNSRSLPSVSAINNMTHHSELIQMAERYIEHEGNPIEMRNFSYPTWIFNWLSYWLKR